MDFVPGYEQEFDGFVSNSLDEPRTVDLYTDADLKDYITILSPTHFTINPKQSVPFKFKIKLPEKFEKPGPHMGVIWADESVEEVPGAAIAKVRVGVRIDVFVPYPGKYLEIDLGIDKANVNDTVIFAISATNRGKENITNARGEIKITDMEQNSTVVILQTEGKPVATENSEVLKATWFSNVDPGLYRAEATVFYDGESAIFERLFNLGAPLIKIINVSAAPVVNGTIGKIYTQIQSFWNQEIKDVYVELYFKNQQNQIITLHKSQNLNIPSFAKQTITSYWDTTEGVEPGDYTGFVTLYYLDKNETAVVDLKVITKPFVIGTEILLIIAAVVAGAIVIVVVMLVLKKRGKRKFTQKKLM